MKFSIRSLVVVLPLAVAVSVAALVFVDKRHDEDKKEHARNLALISKWSDKATVVQAENGVLTGITLSVSLEQLSDVEIDELRELSTLEKLALSRTQEDAGLKLLSGMRSSCNVVLPARITDSVIDELSKLLPSCEFSRRRESQTRRTKRGQVQ